MKRAEKEKDMRTNNKQRRTKLLLSVVDDSPPTIN